MLPAARGKAVAAMTNKAAATSAYKQPISVLVLIYGTDGRILLLERADCPGFWQSVTGSLEMGETPFQAALREVGEETGLQQTATQALYDWQHSSEYEIYAHWRHRYEPGVTRNTEQVFSLQVPANSPICLAAKEHTAWCWYDLPTAAAKVFSPSNRDALLALPQHWPLPAELAKPEAP